MWRRIVQFFHWKPRTYGQVWLSAVLGYGLPGLIVWSVVGRHPMYAAVAYAAGATFFGGLGQCWGLERRRQRGL